MDDLHSNLLIVILTITTLFQPQILWDHGVIKGH